MRGRKEPEEAVNHDRWLVSYADFMTLLFALFVVLFASSHHDRKTIQRVSAAVKNGFQDMGAFSHGATMQDSPPSSVPGDGEPLSQSTTTGDKPATGPLNPEVDIAKLKKDLSKALGQELERQEVDMRMTPEGFVISLHELGFFNSGEARLMPGADDKIKRIAAVLVQYGLDMRVEGHSDDVPIHNAEFASNWDLSTARATAVAMMLLNESGVDPKKIAIAGYGQYHPNASNDTPEGRRANRRVDIVVVSSFHPPELNSK